jgi:DNA-binding FadR family transcriptional regulator
MDQTSKNTLAQNVRPIELLSMHHEVQERIKNYIVEAKLRPDDPLPTEALFAEQLRVSRPVVREALRALESLGIIYSRRGEGRYVSRFNLDPVLQNLNYSLLFDTEDVRQMIEVRERLEASFVGEAIGCMDQGTLEELQVLLDQMRQLAAANGYFLDKDLEFHRALYRPIGNRVLMKLLDVFCSIYQNLRDKSLYVTHDPLAEVENHAQILRAFAAKDVTLAQQLITSHFHGIKDRIKAAQVDAPTWGTPPAEIDPA